MVITARAHCNPLDIVYIQCCDCCTYIAVLDRLYYAIQRSSLRGCVLNNLFHDVYVRLLLSMPFYVYFLYDNVDRQGLMIGLRKELEYRSWLTHTFIWSFVYLSFHWVSHTLVILLQSLLKHDADSHISSGVILYMLYFCIVLVAYAVLILVFFQPIDGWSDLEMLKYVSILHTLHIITHSILSFDLYKELLQIMQLG